MKGRGSRMALMVEDGLGWGPGLCTKVVENAAAKHAKWQFLTLLCTFKSHRIFVFFYLLYSI